MLQKRFLTFGIIHSPKQKNEMAGNEKSSKELASLAGKVLNDPRSPAPAKKLAASVLTQAPDKAPPKKAPAKPAPKAAPKKK